MLYFTPCPSFSTSASPLVTRFLGITPTPHLGNTLALILDSGFNGFLQWSGFVRDLASGPLFLIQFAATRTAPNSAKVWLHNRVIPHRKYEYECSSIIPWECLRFLRPRSAGPRAACLTSYHSPTAMTWSCTSTQSLTLVSCSIRWPGSVLAAGNVGKGWSNRTSLLRSQFYSHKAFRVNGRQVTLVRLSQVRGGGVW